MSSIVNESPGDPGLKLRQPTDFLILEALQEHGRNVAANLQYHTEKSRKNINTRMPILEDYGLVRKIGPAESSGLYEITDKGRRAIMHMDLYEMDRDRFHNLVESNSS